MTMVAGIDLGGTNIAAALVDADNRVVERVKARTPREGPEAVVEVIAEMIADLGQKPAAVGVGAPGPVTDGVVLTAPNLPGWTKPFPLRERLSSVIDRSVAVGNDATVGAVGEWVAGAGQGARFLLGVWLGTGVGGGLVLDGRPYDGAHGGAGEFGHMVVQRGGALCGCGRRGCVEAYAGRAAMERRIEVAVASGRETALLELREAKGKARFTSGVWAKALDKGDPLTVEVLDEAVEALGVAVGSAVNLLDLDCVVIGGGLAEKLGQPLADRIAEAARANMMVPDAERRFVVAELGDDSGVVGAAWMARQAPTGSGGR